MGHGRGLAHAFAPRLPFLAVTENIYRDDRELRKENGPIERGQREECWRGDDFVISADADHAERKIFGLHGRGLQGREAMKERSREPIGIVPGRLTDALCVRRELFGPVMTGEVGG